MRSRLVPVVLALALPWGSGSCRGARCGDGALAPDPPALAPAPAPPEPWELATAWKSNAESYVVRFRPSPEPIPLNEPFALDVWVLAAAQPDRPLVDVELSFDAAMPEHGHGMNRVPSVERLEGGRFRVNGLLLHMSGFWELYFDVARGPITERAQYPLMLE